MTRPNNPSRYFSGRSFSPALLAQEIARETAIVVVRERGKARLYSYQRDGGASAYMNGEIDIRRRIALKLDDRWNTSRARETMTYLFDVCERWS